MQCGRPIGDVVAVVVGLRGQNGPFRVTCVYVIAGIYTFPCPPKDCRPSVNR